MKNKKICIYLIRHATPDWTRTDIPYDIPPGPPLVAQGENEACLLGEFLKRVGVQILFYSPLERAKRTAEIGANIACIPIREKIGLAEWRINESEQQFSQRFIPVWLESEKECERSSAVGLVTHCGPVRFMLENLGLTPDVIEDHRKLFDRGCPLPPAGVWKAEKVSRQEKNWNLELIFAPHQFE